MENKKLFVIHLTFGECGFLSNWAEVKLLASEEYQEKMAEAICEGIVDYLRLVEN